MVQHLDHPIDGRLALLTNPLSKSGLTDAYRRFAPALGGDNTDVLSQLGYSAAEQDELRIKGVIPNDHSGSQ